VSLIGNLLEGSKPVMTRASGTAIRVPPVSMAWAYLREAPMVPRAGANVNQSGTFRPHARPRGGRNVSAPRANAIVTRSQTGRDFTGALGHGRIGATQPSFYSLRIVVPAGAELARIRRCAAMSIDPKSATTPPTQTNLQQTQAMAATHKEMKIFMYPKIIFIVPTFVAALVCGIGMILIGDNTTDPSKSIVATKGEIIKEAPAPRAPGETAEQVRVHRFRSAQNLLGVLFLGVFALNLLIMAIDFPRFTVVLIIVGIAAVTFFLLWLSAWYDWIPPMVRALESVFTVANAQFYFLIATVILFNFGVIFITRYLDYWEVLPNEILHNHGPFSDLERFPTAGLKFDKEIPDILEYALLRSGRLVLHMANERKAIVLDNVLWIDRKEAELKKLMSRLEVRVTTDQETAEPV
jgi:hypothetical protein